MVEIRVERTIAATPERVFEWLADSSNYTASPLCLWEKLGQPGEEAPYGTGAVRYILGAGAWFREVVTSYDPPREFTYTMTGSVPRFEHRGGSVRIAPHVVGSRVVWTTAYAVPWWSGGAIFERISGAMLRVSFESILKAADKTLTG